MLEWEERRGDVIGFYHTHPQGSTSPSRRDVRTMRPGSVALASGVNQETIIQAAGKLGFDQPAFEDCLTSRRYEQEVKEDDQEALQAGARGTLAFLINGRFFPGFMPWETFRSVVEAVLAETAQ